MVETHTTLSGQWQGRFEYDQGGKPSPFEVEFSKDGADLQGQMIEPNSFRRDMGGELTAHLKGSRSGHHVSFVKRYIGFDQGDLLTYDGTVNLALTRMEGRWRFPSQPKWGGRFVMFRKPLSRATAAQKRAATVEV